MARRGMLVRVGLVALILGATACAPAVQRPTLVEAIDNPTAIEQLRRDLRGLFTDATVDHAQWAVHVYSLQHAETLYSLNAFQLMVPASTEKLFTVAAAAATLGWDYRYTTRILATGPVGAGGTLDGDLVVVGNGDPTINPRHPERWRAFDDWAAALSARGIRIVNGRLIGDDRAFAEPGWGAGWAWDDLQYGYAAPVGALQYHENAVEVTVGPGMGPGNRAIITTAPFGSGLIVDHDVVTVPESGETKITLSRVPGTIFLGVHGTVVTGSAPVTLSAAVDNPTRLYLNALREALARHGVFVAAGTADIGELAQPPDLSTATELLVDRSPPLSEIADVLLKWSRNLYAETLLYSMAPVGAPATPEGGLDTLRETLRPWSVLPDFFVPRDGSGLSRYDMVTADSLVWLLTYMWADPALDETMRTSLPVAGVSGTLANRLEDTPAAGRVLAKTGSMTGVRTLAGYLTTLDGEPLAFAIMVNNYRVPGAEIDRRIDQALERLVAFSHRATGR
ncbi:MAG: D-alanyl-D-alanine carboxypeptidase/D-alanyl-D-alanine-endopeptidase [Vicinamibacterales bacterium]